MRRRQLLHYLVAQAALGGSIGSLTGCGTLLHGERRGQRHSGQIDWKVAALNGLGLVFFFVPGVIASAVDFYTGAIYLPGSYAKAGLQRTTLPPDQLTASQVEQVVAQHVGQPVSLQTPTARLSQLTHIDQFDEQCQRHRSDSEFGHAVRSFFSKWTPA